MFKKRKTQTAGPSGKPACGEGGQGSQADWVPERSAPACHPYRTSENLGERRGGDCGVPGGFSRWGWLKGSQAAALGSQTFGKAMKSQLCTCLLGLPPAKGKLACQVGEEGLCGQGQGSATLRGDALAGRREISEQEVNQPAPSQGKLGSNPRGHHKPGCPRPSLGEASGCHVQEGTPEWGPHGTTA